VPDDVTPIFRMYGAQLETDSMINWNPLLGPVTGARQSPARQDGRCPWCRPCRRKKSSWSDRRRLAGGSLFAPETGLEPPLLRHAVVVVLGIY